MPLQLPLGNKHLLFLLLLVKQGGIELILEAMTQHKNVAGVQEQACGTLWNLAGGDPDRLKANGIISNILQT